MFYDVIVSGSYSKFKAFPVPALKMYLEALINTLFIININLVIHFREHSFYTTHFQIFIIKVPYVS